MRHLYITNIVASVALAGALVLTPLVSTAETTVFNSFSVTSSTGGNSAKGGQVIEGESHSTVDITTVVNGETVVDLHEESDEGSISVESSTYADTSGATSTTRVEHGSPVSEQTVSQDTVLEMPAPRAVLDHPVATVTATSTISNRHDEADDAPESASAQASPLARFVRFVSHTLSYVLSNLFS